jgi:hypothetical protein
MTWPAELRRTAHHLRAQGMGLDARVVEEALAEISRQQERIELLERLLRDWTATMTEAALSDPRVLHLTRLVLPDPLPGKDEPG